MLFKSILLIFALPCAHCAKILGIFPMASTSHYILYSKLMKGLINAGHDVTMASPHSMNLSVGVENYTEIILDGFADEFEEWLKQLDYFNNYAVTTSILSEIVLTSGFLPSINNTLHHPEMRKLVESKPHFDILIIQQFFNDALKVYSYIFNAPMIILSPFGPNPWVNAIVGNPQPVSYVQTVFGMDSKGEFDLVKRAKNMLKYIVFLFIRNLYVLPAHNKIKNAIYPDSPSVQELEKNVSIIFLSTHTSIEDPVPLVPNMIEIGGYFIDPPQKLPVDLQDFMDDAPHGVVYFSMGSILKSTEMSLEKKQMFINVLGRLKQKVIWKFEEDLPRKPDNILIKKWFPQQDILAHPNIKLFITHGGLLSTSEAIYHGIPLLAIPVFADQPMNAAKAVTAGYALSLHYADPNFDEETLWLLINELLSNPRYSEIAKQRSKLFHNRPMSPMETVVYWVDYVVRHKGAPHLRVKGADLPWYQYHMIDVIGVIACLLYLVIFVVTRLFRMFRKISVNMVIKKNN